MKLVNLTNAVRQARECAYNAREKLRDMPSSNEREMIVDLQYWLIELTDMLNDLDVTIHAEK